MDIFGLVLGSKLVQFLCFVVKSWSNPWPLLFLKMANLAKKVTNWSKMVKSWSKICATRLEKVTKN